MNRNAIKFENSQPEVLEIRRTLIHVDPEGSSEILRHDQLENQQRYWTRHEVEDIRNETWTEISAVPVIKSY